MAQIAVREVVQRRLVLWRVGNAAPQVAPEATPANSIVETAIFVVQEGVWH